jgi:hypothetical protein
VPVRELRAALAQKQRRERDCGEPDGDVDEEDPRPAQIRGEQPAEQHAGGRAASGCGGVDPEREVAFAALREGRHQQRERGGDEHCPTDALHGAEADQRRFRPGQPAEQGGGREDREAGNEEAPSAQQVGEAPAEQERPAEEDRVRGDHPLQVGLRKIEIGLDRRKRDVHDRDIEDDHELRCDDERQREPAGITFCGA